MDTRTLFISARTIDSLATFYQWIRSRFPISGCTGWDVSRPWKKTESGYRNRRLLGGCSEDMHSHSLTHSIWSHPLLTHPLSLSIPDTCRCRSTWWGEIVNDASHRKSGSPGHATPSPCELLFNWALFMKLDVAQNQTCKPAARFPSTSAGINRGKQKKGNRPNRVEFGWKEIFPRICAFILCIRAKHRIHLFRNWILGPFPFWISSIRIRLFR